MWFLLAALLLTAFLLYKLWIRPYDYWKKKGFPHIEATFPSGSLFGLSYMTQFQGDGVNDLYNKLSPHPYGGVIILRRPHLLVRDVEIVKRVMVKDFDYFRDRTTAENIKEPDSEHIFNLPGEKWRVKRVNLGPIFSASKVKSFFTFFDVLKGDLFNLLDKVAADGKPFDSKSTMSRFTMDFIGSWVFGTRINSLVESDHVLYVTARKMFPAYVPNEFRLKQCFFNFFSFLDGIARFCFLPVDFTQAVDNYVKAGLEYKEKNENYKSVDFIDTLYRMQKKGVLTSDRVIISDGSTQKITENKIDLQFHDLSAEALILFAAGYDTASSTIAYTLFELAWNQQIQQRLVQEIQEATDRHGGLTYQAIQEMAYLDQIVSETLRMYPPVPVLTRKCTRDYQMPDRPDLIVERGTRVIIPLMSLHMDPKLFPDPQKYNPERFSPENKDNIQPYSYMPFGEGPRYCIGKRMGLIETKMGIALTVSRYKVLVSEITQKRVKFESTLLVLSSKTPIWVKLERR